MGFRLAVSGGAENINLDEKTIQKVTFSSDSATDSNARATDFGIAVKITGKMLYTRLRRSRRRRWNTWIIQMVSGSVRAGRLLQKCTDRCCISRTGGKKVHNPQCVCHGI